MNTLVIALLIKPFAVLLFLWALLAIRLIAARFLPPGKVKNLLLARIHPERADWRCLSEYFRNLVVRRRSRLVLKRLKP